MGHGPNRGSLPRRTLTGPRTTIVFEIVSFTVTVSVSVLPDTRPENEAGIVGPIATGYARNRKLPVRVKRPLASSVTRPVRSP
jgi:hypothetical protein